jgi:SanA protein
MTSHRFILRTKNYIENHLKSLLLLFIGVVVSFTFASFVIIQKESSKIYSLNEAIDSDSVNDANVGIVFGGGVAESEPLPLVRERLNTAKLLLDMGVIDTLLLSGDNRSLDYNEPAVMQAYLVNTLGVDPIKLQPDFAGRSTYETCERASKVFRIDTALLISESTHLPRAIYLCEHFGVTSYGIKSDGDPSSGLQAGQRWREVMARNKAVLNIHVYGEKTVLGDPIPITNF